MDTVIRNANLVTPGGIFRGDLGIKDGKIVQIGQVERGTQEIDAEGRWLLPGAIDSHTHMHLPFGDSYSADDFYSGTVAAACGGVTTIIDFATPPRGQSPREAIAHRRAEADPEVVIDYALHAGITTESEESLAEIAELVQAGSPSLKLFTAYSNLQVGDGFLYRVMEEAKRQGALVGVHAENGDVLETLRQRFIQEGKTGPIYHYLSRPAFVEAEAVNRVARLAIATQSPLYVFHLASEDGLETIRQARRNGYQVMAETCPHYLIYNCEVYSRPDARRFILSPPMKEESDLQSLWKGLQAGDIQVVATDHCPFMVAEKQGPFERVPNGIGGVETLLPLLYSEGVAKKRLSIERLVQVLSANPAKIFGLKEKGSLLPGFDADLVLIDPRRSYRIEAAKHFSRSDYSPYEGLEVEGQVVMTFSRGELVYREGEFLGRRGFGRFISRTSPQPC